MIAKSKVESMIVEVEIHNPPPGVEPGVMKDAIELTMQTPGFMNLLTSLQIVKNKSDSEASDGTEQVSSM